MWVSLIPWLFGLVALGVVEPAASSPDRLRRLQEEIGRLGRELDELGGREQGVLGELATLDAELRLRRVELSEVELRLEGTLEGIASSERRLAGLREAQDDRRRYLAFRLREMYKAGRDGELQRLVGGGEAERYWSGLRYASFLSQRDSRVLLAFRRDAEQVGSERDALEARATELSELRTELEGSRRRVGASRRRRAGLLTRIRDDKSKREAAIEELRGAAAQLGTLIETLGRAGEAPTLDVRKFRGLLDWPAQGAVSVPFGTTVHPRFKTELPHPGLDIAADAGDPIRCVFEGRVVFADWLRGYGLTAIVDHGSSLLSVYAHARALVVERGEQLLRGQLIGQVGDTGSLKGPYLYFELRLDGRPADPARWLRPR